jgi:hypothetical protein
VIFEIFTNNSTYDNSIDNYTPSKVYTSKLTKSNVAIADYLAYEEEQLEPWAKAHRLGYC